MTLWYNPHSCKTVAYRTCDISNNSYLLPSSKMLHQHLLSCDILPASSRDLPSHVLTPAVAQMQTICGKLPEQVTFLHDLYFPKHTVCTLRAAFHGVEAQCLCVLVHVRFRPISYKHS